MKYLFVAGHWHGEVREIPDGYRHWRVPVPSPLQWTPLGFGPYEPATRIELYRHELALVGYKTIPVYVLDVLHRDWHRTELISALVIAAGLDEPRR